MYAAQKYHCKRWAFKQSCYTMASFGLFLSKEIIECDSWKVIERILKIEEKIIK